MLRVAGSCALLLVCGLLGATLAPAQSDRLAQPQPGAGTSQRSERTIVCNRRRCWTIRENCRFVLGPHPRENRIRCAPGRPA
jgi:hypothetical protein